jgi:hypothetical protein
VKDQKTATHGTFELIAHFLQLLISTSGSAPFNFRRFATYPDTLALRN